MILYTFDCSVALTADGSTIVCLHSSDIEVSAPTDAQVQYLLLLDTFCMHTCTLGMLVVIAYRACVILAPTSKKAKCFT